VRRNGFTLIEVLVALAIVTLGMSAVLSALTSAASNTAALRNKSMAEWIAMNQITSTRVNLNAPAVGSTSGDLDFANGRWHWEQDVDNPGIIPGLLRITVKVRQLASSTSGSSQSSASSASSSSTSASSSSGDASATNWLANVVGFRGDALAAPNGEVPNWTGTDFNAGSNTNTGNAATNGAGGIRNPGTGLPGSSTAPSTTPSTPGNGSTSSPSPPTLGPGGS
jgi:general secretion pathway protein I